MDSPDLQVLHGIQRWTAAGQRFVLVTVARTWGSAPRPAGAWLALRSDGALLGSVSGGCVEDDLVRRMAAGELAGDKPFLLRYGITREEAARCGLPCGGTLELVVEPAPDPALLAELAARMAQALDYAVTVCDPRVEYTGEWDVSATELTTEMPDDAVLALAPDPHTAIVTLTHDPKLDDMALLEALKSPAFYVGALGSRRSTAARKARLLEYFDLTAEDIGRLRGPVGLPIGSRTPAEIAVAILAEMTAVKHGAAVAVHGKPAPELAATAGGCPRRPPLASGPGRRRRSGRPPAGGAATRSGRTRRTAEHRRLPTGGE